MVVYGVRHLELEHKTALSRLSNSQSSAGSGEGVKREPDWKRMLRALEVNPQGVHSHDIRRWGLSGHPSERVADIERNTDRKVDRITQYRDGRNGTLYKLIGLSGEEQPAVAADSGQQRPSGVSPSSPPAPEGPAALFEPTEARERPLNAFTDAEAA